MDSLRRDVFDKYLAYGGVDVSPNMFAGTDVKTFENMDTEQIMAATAQPTVSQDKDDLGKNDSRWVVDFEGCMKGFL